MRILKSGQMSDDLETWMDEVPWIGTEFAHLCLGKSVPGLRSIEMIWSTYCNVPTRNAVPLGPEFVVGNRNAILRQLIHWMGTEVIDNNHRLIRIEASSHREVLDFVAAGIRSASEVECAKLASKVVIVDDEASAVTLRGISPHHTLLGTGKVIPHIIALSRKTNCKVIIYHQRSDAVTSPLPWIHKIDLKPIPKSDMIGAVTAFGYAPEEAARICEENVFDYERVRNSVFLC